MTDSSLVSDEIVITVEMLADLVSHIADLDAQVGRAQAEQRAWQAREVAAQARRNQIAAIHEYVKHQVGESLQGLLVVIEDQLTGAEAMEAEARADYEAARERLRDLQGYQRVLAQQTAGEAS